MIKPIVIAIVVPLMILAIIGYWMTGRMDPALVSVGLNYTDCYQAFGTTYCGERGENLRRTFEVTP